MSRQVAEWPVREQASSSTARGSSATPRGLSLALCIGRTYRACRPWAALGEVRRPGGAMRRERQASKDAEDRGRSPLPTDASPVPDGCSSQSRRRAARASWNPRPHRVGSPAARTPQHPRRPSRRVLQSAHRRLQTGAAASRPAAGGRLVNLVARRRPSSSRRRRHVSPAPRPVAPAARFDSGCRQQRAVARGAAGCRRTGITDAHRRARKSSIKLRTRPADARRGAQCSRASSRFAQRMCRRGAPVQVARTGKHGLNFCRCRSMQWVPNAKSSCSQGNFSRGCAVGRADHRSAGSRCSSAEPTVHSAPGASTYRQTHSPRGSGALWNT